MITDVEKQARLNGELIRELLDSRIPKSEREHAAAREIEALRAENERLRESRNEFYHAAEGRRLANSDLRRRNAELQARVTELEAENEAMKRCPDTIAKLLKERDALRDALSEAQTRIAALGYPVSPDGEYSKDGEWTFSDAVPRAVDAEEVKAAFLVIRDALARLNGDDHD